MITANLRIVGHQLPGRTCSGHHNVHVGVQHRRDVIDYVPGDTRRAVFEIPLEVILDPVIGIDFRGPLAHGPRGQRFIYLSWGEVTDRSFAMFRRAKLKLSTLPDHIAQALADGCTVQAEVDLTGPDGGPLCASIPATAIAWSIDDAEGLNPIPIT
jgi:hypothetical protein